jgi:hypothetical protein
MGLGLVRAACVRGGHRLDLVGGISAAGGSPSVLVTARIADALSVQLRKLL